MPEKIQWYEDKSFGPCGRWLVVFFVAAGCTMWDTSITHLGKK